MKKLKILCSIISLFGVFYFTNIAAMEKAQDKKIDFTVKENLFENVEQKEEIISENFPVKVEVKNYDVNKPGHGEINIIFDLSADEPFNSRFWFFNIENLETRLNSSLNFLQEYVDIDEKSTLDEDDKEFLDSHKAIFTLGENGRYNKINENAFYDKNLLKALALYCNRFKNYGPLEQKMDRDLFGRPGSDYYKNLAINFRFFVNMLKNFESKIEFDDPYGYQKNKNFNGRVVIKISNSKDELAKKFKYFQDCILQIRERFHFYPFILARAFFYVIMEKYMREQNIFNEAIGNEYYIDLNNNVLSDDYVLSEKIRENIILGAEKGKIEFNGTEEDFKNFFEIAYEEINSCSNRVKISKKEEYVILGTLFFKENIDNIRFSDDGSKIIFKFKERSDVFTKRSPSGFKKYSIDANLFKLLNFQQYIKGWRITPLKSYANIIREIVFIYKEQELAKRFGQKKELDQTDENAKEQVSEGEFSFKINPYETLNYVFKNIKKEVIPQVKDKKIAYDETEEDFNKFYEIIYNKLLTIPEYEKNIYLKDIFNPENVQFIINNDLGEKITFKFKDNGYALKRRYFEFVEKFKKKSLNFKDYVYGLREIYNYNFLDLAVQIVLLYKEICKEKDYEKDITLKEECEQKTVSEKEAQNNIDFISENLPLRKEEKNISEKEESYFKKPCKNELINETEELKNLQEAKKEAGSKNEYLHEIVREIGFEYSSKQDKTNMNDEKYKNLKENDNTSEENKEIADKTEKEEKDKII